MPPRDFASGRNLCGGSYYLRQCFDEAEAIALLFLSPTGGPVSNTPIPEKTGSCMEVRLNSPRGKFKRTNMADDEVDLTPEDIPGAKLY